MPLLPLGELVGRTYLRFTAVDRPGVLAHITGVLGEYEIGIASVIQKGRAGPVASVPVLLQTHSCTELALRSALSEIDRFRVGFLLLTGNIAGPPAAEYLCPVGVRRRRADG